MICVTKLEKVLTEMHYRRIIEIFSSNHKVWITLDGMEE